MRITRVFLLPDGRSAFDDLDVPIHSQGNIGALSALYPVQGVVFRETSGDYHFDWHPAPQRQFIILLEGTIGIETGSGETRTFSGGDILLVEDTEPPGHRTWSIDGKTRRSLFLPLAVDIAFP